MYANILLIIIQYKNFKIGINDIFTLSYYFIDKMWKLSGSPRPLLGLEIHKDSQASEYSLTHSKDLSKCKDAKCNQQKEQTCEVTSAGNHTQASESPVPVVSQDMHNSSSNKW